MSVAWLALTPGELNALTLAGFVDGTPTWVERVSPLAGSTLEWLTPTAAAEQLRTKVEGLADPDLRRSLAVSLDRISRILGAPQSVMSVRFGEPGDGATMFVLAVSSAGVASLVLEGEEILARQVDPAALAGELELLEQVGSYARRFAVVSDWGPLPGALEYRDGMLVGHDEHAGLSLLGEFDSAPEAVGWIATQVTA